MLLILLVSQTILAQECTNQFFNSISSKCESCPSGSGLIENQCTCTYTINGVPKNSVCAAETNQCISDIGQWVTNTCSCSGHAIPTSTNLCQQCPNNQINSSGKCACASTKMSSDGFCVTQYVNVFTDDISQTLGPKAYDGCNLYNDMKSCQQLANLFILKRSVSNSDKDYSYLYGAIINFQASAQKNMPKIIYTETSVSIIEQTSLQMQVNFKSDQGNSLNKLPFYIMEYYIDGTVSQLKPLANQLQLCSTSFGDATLSSYFGVGYKNDCQVDLSKYTEGTYQTVFYQLWLLDTDGTYIPIPVKIAGYDANTSGESESDYGYTNAKFLTRFFMVDNKKQPSQIIYAEQVKLISYLSTTENDKTFLPYLYIIYSDPITYTAIKTSSYYTAKYGNFHYQAQTNFYNVAAALLIVAQVLIVIIWFIRIYVWSKRNPAYTAQYDWCMYLTVRSFYVLLDTWAEVTFYYLAIFTGYLFCFFKFQQTIYLLMPPLSDYASNYRPFEILFHSMLACRLISMINLILRQSDVQVFFIDWEKTEVLRPKELQEQLDPNILNIVQQHQSKQSAWRMILIANEFNELQTYRIVSVEWTLFFVGFFLEGLKWINLAQDQPNITLDRVIPKNYVLQYFLGTFLYMAIGLAQIIIQKIFDIWFPILVEDFVDLCAIANVSIVILDDALHGYYIHGENPIGYAEGSSEHLANCLHYESMGKGKRRGFIQEPTQQHPDDVDLQTFELFLPMRFREAYEQVYNLPLKTMTDQAQYQNYNEIRVLRQGVPDGLQMAGVQAIKDVFQAYIKDILTQVRANFSKCVRDKLPVQRFFDYPPADLEDYYFKDQSMPVFFRDPDQTFKSMFFCGHEFFFLITDCIIFNFWMIISNNTYLSIMLTYLVSAGIFNYRQWVGERNLADQSKIDQRFLI